MLFKYNKFKSYLGRTILNHVSERLIPEWYSSNFKSLLRYYCASDNTRMDTEKETEWNIFLSDEEHSLNLGNYGIVILNMPLTLPSKRISSLWSKACWRITVDGGTDRWFDFVKRHSLDLPLPEYVTGDFDSIKTETLDFCNKQDGITVCHTPDQDFTDFDKALGVLSKTCPHKLDCFLALSEHAGRLDQTFSNLNALSRAPLQGYILSESAITWLLCPSSHKINIPNYLRGSKKYCGILPFSSAAKVTTKGLKWDLNEDIIQFGGLISSSNYCDESPVMLQTDKTVIWTMSYGKE